MIYEDISIDKWTKNDSLLSLFTSYTDFEIGQERFQLLQSKIAMDDKTSKLNKRISKFYNKHTLDINKKTEEASKSFDRNVSYWEENEEWFNLAYADFD